MNAFEYTSVISAFLTETLRGDAVLTNLIGTRVYDSERPQAKDQAQLAALYPCVLFYIRAYSRALLGNGDNIVWVPSEAVVIGMDISLSWTRLEPIAARIYQLLHGNNGVNVTTGGYINTCTFRRPEKVPETVNDVHYKRLGGVFEIAARLSAS